MKHGLCWGIVALLAAVLSGCAPSASTTPVDTAPVDYSHLRADDIAFQLDEGPGSPMPPGSEFLLPQVSVYGDGRVVRLVDDPANPYRWPVLTQQTLSPVGMQRLLGAARDAGLAEATDFGDTPNLVDGSVTTFRLLDRKTEVANMFNNGTAPAARERLRSFVTRVKDLDRWMGAEVSSPVPYSYSKAALFVWPQDPGKGETYPAWPLADLGGGIPQERGGLCTVVDVVSLDRVRNAQSEPRLVSFWQSHGASYAVTVRPLLPGETDCASVVG